MSGHTSPETWQCVHLDDDPAAMKKFVADRAFDRTFHRVTHAEDQKLDAALEARSDLRCSPGIVEWPAGVRLERTMVWSVHLQLTLWSLDACLEGDPYIPVRAAQLAKLARIPTAQTRLALDLLNEIGRAEAIEGGYVAYLPELIGGDHETGYRRLYDRLIVERGRAARLLDVLSISGQCGLCRGALFGGGVLAERNVDGKYEAAAVCAGCRIQIGFIASSDPGAPSPPPKSPTEVEDPPVPAPPP